MKNGLPAIYWTFRYAWSVAHIVLVAIIALSFLGWAFTDNQGADAFNAAYYWLDDLRYTMSRLIPFPWE